MKRTIFLAIAAGAILLPAAAPAQYAGSYQDAKLRFTSKQPGHSTGLRLRVDYKNPADPAAKPPAVRQVTEVLARGARFDTSAPAACTASDVELMLLGGAACPAGSRVGEGLITLDTGLPQPGRFLASPADFFNNTGELIFLNRIAGTESPRLVTRAEVHGRRSTSEAPFLPGTPPDGAAVDTVYVEGFEVTRMVDGERRSYITTPPRCRPRGYWINRVEFTYADGVTQTVRSRSRCEAGDGR